MATYAIDSSRTELVSTGIVEAVREWTETADGSRRPSDVQARAEGSGVPLWAVEVAFTSMEWGRESTGTARVTVPAPAQPVVGRYAPVQFRNLVIEARVNRKTTALVESWRADEVVAPTGAKRDGAAS